MRSVLVGKLQEVSGAGFLNFYNVAKANAQQTACVGAFISLINCLFIQRSEGDGTQRLQFGRMTGFPAKNQTHISNMRTPP